MGKTISTHNGSSANRDHNVRNPNATDKQEHIDKSLVHQNEILHDEKPREAYKRIFGEALEKYNAKQTRDDRKIKDYFTHVEKDSKKHAVYEMIVQIGDRNDTGINAPVERECLHEFYEGWKERNPNLECIGAYIHADERDGTIHMHIDYVPVATGYKKGLEVQNGLVKALEQQGFEKDGKVTAQIQWQARENAALELICERHGIEVYHPKEENRKHLTTEQYKAEQRLKEVEQKLEKAQEDVRTARQELKSAKMELAFAVKENNRLNSKIELLKEQENKLIGTVEKVKTFLEKSLAKIDLIGKEKDKLESELPVLKEQINEQRAELGAVEEAIKRKMEEGSGYFTIESIEKKVAEVRKEQEREKHYARLDREVSLFNSFLENFPQVKSAWEKVKESITKEANEKEKQKPQKKNELVK